MTINLPEVVIKSSKDATTTWSRHIKLEYAGQIYGVVLEWGEYDGFHAFWSDKDGTQIENPKWAPSDLDLLHLATDWECRRR